MVADLETGTTLDFVDGYHEITVDSHGLLMLVADGMGGAASGELASGMASSTILDTLRSLWTPAAPTVPGFAEALRDATIHANHRVHEHAQDNPEHRGMGTTATIAGFLGDHAYVAQVGDSRAYLVRDGVARQLTKDQSLIQRLVEAGEMSAEEAEVSERRNIILQALGPEAQVLVDITHQQLRRGDVLVLCSDGLSGLVRAPEIAAAVDGEPDVRVICRSLIDLANSRGGPDNITVVAAHFDGSGLLDGEPGEYFGYKAFPLSGTLNTSAHETPDAPSTAIKTDPTPMFGIPAQSMPPSVFKAEASGEEQQFVQTAVAGGESSSLATLAEDEEARVQMLERRRRAVKPIYALLATVALAALLFMAWRLVGAV